MPNHKPDLVRAIGRWTLAALMVNIVIGGGIFGLPSTVAGILGGQSPIAYLIAACGNWTIAACVAEVASRFQQAGGPYLYTKTAFARFGPADGMASVVDAHQLRCRSGQRFHRLPVGVLAASQGASTAVWVILTILIGGLAATNILGVKMGTWVSNFFTIAKLLPLGILVVGGLLFMGLHGSPVRPVARSHPTGAWMSAVLLLIFAYGGFEAALIPAGEIKNPSRNGPIALLAALIIITTVYCLVQVVVIQTLPNSALTSRSLSAAAQVFGGSRMATIISAGALLSTFGRFAATMIATRQ